MKSNQSITEYFRQPRPSLILMTGSVLTVMGTWLAYSADSKRREVEFDMAVTAGLATVSKRLEAYAAVLESTRSFVTSTALTRTRFASFIGGLDSTERFPDMQGIGFAPVFASPSDVVALKDRAANEGFANFKVWSDGGVPLRSAILYLEPMDARNRAAIGFDMMSEPKRRLAMERAAQTGHPAVSEHIRLKQDAASPARQLGFLIYLPVYTVDALSDSNARSRLNGYVHAAVRSGDFFRSLFEGTGQQLAVAVRDLSAVSADDEPLYTSAHFAAQRSDAKQIRTYEYGGQQWSFEFRPVIGSALDRNSWSFSAGVATLGAIATLFLVTLTTLQANSRRASAKHAGELEEALVRETQLKNLAQSLSALALETGSETDIDRVVQRITHRATELTGASFGAYFHNKQDAQGHFGLYALAGAPSAAFDKFPPLRATPLFAATFGGQTVRLDDVRASPLSAAIHLMTGCHRGT